MSALRSAPPSFAKGYPQPFLYSCFYPQVSQLESDIDFLRSSETDLQTGLISKEKRIYSLEKEVRDKDKQGNNETEVRKQNIDS